MQTKQRAKSLVLTGLAAAAVAGVMITTAALTGSDEAAVAGGPRQAGQETRQPGTAPVKKAPKATKYTFQNQRPPVGTLPVDGEVRIADHLYFATRGTRWAVISRKPGEPEYEPFGWRRTVGNDNLGAPASPGVQSVGPVQSSVFRGERVSTVVYTEGTKAWYAKVHRLAGIPGWVQSSAETDGGAATRETPGPRGSGVSVFAYDEDGKLVARFGEAKGDPLAK